MSVHVKSLSISSKVVAASITVFAAAVFIVAFATYALMALNNTNNHVVTVEAPKLAAVLSAKSNVNHAAFLERNFLIETTQEGRTKQQKSFETELEKLRTSLRLVSSSAGPEETRAVERSENAVTDFLRVTSQTFDKARAGDGAAAFKSSQNEGAKAYNELKGALEQLRKAVEDKLDFARAESAALYQSTVWRLALLSLIGSLLTIATIAFIVRRVSRPLRQITAHMEHLANGNLDGEIIGSERRDEVGALARSLSVFKQNAVKANSLEEEKRKEQARSQHRQSVVESCIASFGESVHSLISALTMAATDLRQTAEGLSQTAKETTNQAEAVDLAASEASSNIQMLATSTANFSRVLATMGGQASHSAVIASNATLDAKQTDHTVSGLADATEKIGKVLALIQEIANRTNLLALNATIESARAGEHGKGFAVVAGEVKALSMQTTAATREIGEQIEAIQSASQGSVSAIKKIAETITEINTAASAISHAVGDQQNTAQNIARSVQEAARYAEIVSSNIAGVKQVATTTGSASVQVLSAAEDFGLRAEALRSEIDSFFARLRAA